MDAARWQALETAFEVVQGLSGEERERWLAARSEEDPALAEELRALLAAAELPGALDVVGARFASVREVLDGELGDASPQAAGGGWALPPRAGRYVVVGEIGRGGMGVVCRAHDPRLGRDVALKIFPHVSRGDADDDVERRVLAEARAASALDHPNICTIYDVGTLDDGRPYLAMAYCSGGTLADRLRDGPLPVRDAVTIARELADALACAHEAGIIHRDVKPHNVAFGERGEAKLLDFGVALLRDQSGGARAGGGTAAYMSPEQVREERVDERADVWALGVVLFEMLAGSRPFAGADRGALLRAIVRDEPADLAALRPDVPPALAAAVARALRKSPGERWPDAAAMSAALGEVLATPSPSRLWRRRAVAGALLLVAGAGAAAALARDRSPEAPERGTAAHGPVAATSGLLARALDRYKAASAEGLEEAITLVRMALAGDPESAAAHALLARAYTVSTFEGRSRAGQAAWIDSAVAHARRSTRLAPQSPDGWAALGVAYAALGRHAEAVAQFRRAIDLEPRHASAMMDLARSYSLLGQYEEAVRWTERGLRTDSTLPGAHARASQRYRRFDLPDEARRHIANGLRVTPTETYLRWESILLALWVGDTADARRQLAEYLPLVPPHDHARLRASFELLRGDPYAARPHVDQAIGTISSANDLRVAGITYVLTGERTRGDSLLRRELKRLRADAQSGREVRGTSALEMARLYAVLGERDSAVAALASWDSTGGTVSWRNTVREPGWASLRDDPRFQAIVARADARFRAARDRMVAQLARTLREGAAGRR